MNRIAALTLRPTQPSSVALDRASRSRDSAPRSKQDAHAAVANDLGRQVILNPAPRAGADRGGENSLRDHRSNGADPDDDQWATPGARRRESRSHRRRGHLPDVAPLREEDRGERHERRLGRRLWILASPFDVSGFRHTRDRDADEARGRERRDEPG